MLDSKLLSSSLQNRLVLLSSIVKLLVFAWIKVASVSLLFTTGWKNDFYKCVCVCQVLAELSRKVTAAYFSSELELKR